MPSGDSLHGIQWLHFENLMIFNPTLNSSPSEIHAYPVADGLPGLYDVRDGNGCLIATDVTERQVDDIARRMGARVVR